MRTITTLGNNELQNKRVILRLDLNVPVLNGVVTDDFRVISSLPTLKFLLDNGAHICVISHCEANKGDRCSLKQAAETLGKHVDVIFVENIEEAKKLQEENEKKVIVIENIRQYEGEKENDENFVRNLASLGDIYVNEAFPVSHRKHASIVGISKLLPSYAGIQLEKEVQTLSKAFNPTHPFVFILGGAKFETKMPLIEKFIEMADYVFIGGALANDLIKAEGLNVGKSLVSPNPLNLDKIIKSPKLIPIVDVVVGHNGEKIIKNKSQINDEEIISDIGPQTIEKLKEKVFNASYVLWNGPLGNCENGFTEGTVGLASAMAETKAETILGGGDTVGAIRSLNLGKHFTFISTGGGATLDFLANETLPGIEDLG